MPPQCGDEYVVHLNTNPLVPSTSFPFEGSDEQVLAQAAPRGDFAIPAALDGLIVSCVVTMYAPVDASANADGSPRIGALSIALLGSDNVNGPAPGAHLDWWRTANGYAPPGGDIAGPQVYSQPLAADGSQTRTIYFNGVDPAMAPQLSDLTGVEIDPFGAFVVLTDYTIAQP
ncbi:hypothetical protein C1N71_05370 [Agrococcus sp. SGAir0287]|nr:hypothetical protein C1N71_05370 [Agrococcus sp. SGAir0287]